MDLRVRRSEKNDNKTVSTEFTMYVRPPGNPGVPPIPILFFFKTAESSGGEPKTWHDPKVLDRIFSHKFKNLFGKVTGKLEP